MIEIYRGDHRFLAFQRADESGSIITTDPNQIYFTFREDYESDNFIFQKRFKRDDAETGEITKDVDGTWIINILPTDTADLDFGTYVCDVKIEDENGLEIHVVPPQKIRIAAVATHYKTDEE